MARPKKEVEDSGEIDLNELDNTPDKILTNLVKEIDRPKIEAQRAADKESDYDDTDRGQRQAAKIAALEKKLAEAEDTLRNKGLVLADGTPQFKKTKEPIDPERQHPEAKELYKKEPYKNYPIQKIEGKAVRFVSSRPFHDKTVSWDDGYRQDSQHFNESDHPLYVNAVYCHVSRFVNFDKAIKDAYVIRTDDEIQLYFAD